MVLITNSTYQDFRAKVNGLGQVMSAFGRFIILNYHTPKSIFKRETLHDASHNKHNAHSGF